MEAHSVALPVKRFHVPSNYLKHSTNNIALLETSSMWPSTNPDIAIINLPTAKPEWSMEFMVPGWGRLYRVSVSSIALQLIHSRSSNLQSGILAGHLTHISVKLLEREKCLRMITSNQLLPEMLCALNELNSSPCAGDSGAPMIHDDTIYGVASYLTGCGHVAMPTIYTDVWYHMDWINSTLLSRANPLACNLCVFFFFLFPTLSTQSVLWLNN